MPNAEALRLALKLVERAAEVELPEGDYDDVVKVDQPPVQVGWNQRAWINVARVPQEGFCLTAGCLAGHVVMNEGFTEVISGRFGNFNAIRNPATGQTLAFDGSVNSVPIYAQQVLDLTDEQAEKLFHSDNELSDLRYLVNEFCDEA